MPIWVITGAGGALGSDLLDVLSRSGDDAVGLGRDALDVADAAAVEDLLASLRPDVLVNAAAYTRVDDAESDEAAAMRVNGDAPGVLARWCAAHATRLIHISTDYVFRGDADSPYDVAAPTGPTGAYGRTKLAGEQAVLAVGGDVHIVRTGWLYGAHGSSFIRTVGQRLLAGATVDVVDDQRGAPTWTADLAQRLVALGGADVAAGVWHCSAAGEASWFDVAVALAELLGRNAEQVRPTTSATMNRPAPRPACSVLSNDKWVTAGLPAMPPWRDGLAAALDATGGALTATL